MASVLGVSDCGELGCGFDRCQVSTVADLSVCSLVEKELNELCLSRNRGDMQRCVSVQRLAVDVRVAFLNQDSRNIHISNHRGAVKRRETEVVRNVNVCATLDKSQNGFRMSFRPRGVQKRRFTTLCATGNVRFVFQEK